jgi:hypothetical protein
MGSVVSRWLGARHCDKSVDRSAASTSLYWLAIHACRPSLKYRSSGAAGDSGTLISSSVATAMQRKRHRP